LRGGHRSTVVILLLAFAFVAGAGTAITPCVLPVLPALLSAGGTGGRRRPLGVIAGLAATHTIAILSLASLIQGVGLADGFVRTFAVFVLLGFGLTLLLPRLAERLERPLARLTALGPRSRGEGFWSGLGVGGALGFVYAPCAGPIVAAVISVSASQGTTAKLVAVALAYSLGSALVLLLLALGGRRLMDRVRAAGRGPTLQRALGVVMVVTGLAVATDLDVRFQTALANDFPDLLVNPTEAIERSDLVESRLAGLRGEPRFDSDQEVGATAAVTDGPDAPSLPVLGRAPEFAGTQRWFNTPGGRPLTLTGLRGKVVLIDFWTYTCINCLRTFPHLRAWYDRYRDDGLVIVGVHTPEFTFERDPSNVADAVGQNGLRYPVAQDNDYATWNAWGNQFWPAKYLVDAEGRVRYTHFGEGAYDETEAAIRALLEESGDARLGGPTDAHGLRASAGVETPETYLGFERARPFLPGGTLTPGRRDYPGVDGPLPSNHFALEGRWDVDRESATAVRGASLGASFGARRVYLVLSPPERGTGEVRVALDGKPIPARLAGEDVGDSRVKVGRQRLYELVELPAAGRHRLSLDFDRGVAGYAFTFG
jgi:cytochrome c biogenesis protein CcdA/thiol-disulfide isomerase/thioredoxin